MIGIGYRISLWDGGEGPTTETTTTTTTGDWIYLGDWRFGDKDDNFAVDYNVPPWTTIFEV